VHALVASRIDFCNSILYRPVASVHLRPLQSAQNAAARLVLKLSKFDRDAVSTTICNELHWLPVHKRIVYRNYASLCSNINTSRPQHTCRHFVRRSQLSQSVVSCGQQPKATSITREHELSYMAHGHSQFLNLHVGTYFRSVISEVTVAETRSFLLRCIECRRGLALRNLSVRLSVTRVSLTKWKKDRSRFLYHTKEHLS